MFSFRKPSTAMKAGFTLIELLVVIGIIGTLASVVITAINPTKQLADAADAKRNQRVNQIEKAIMQYLIEYGELPGDKAIPRGEGNAVDICRNGVTDAGCINLDELLPTFTTCIPYDAEETDPNNTGFTIYNQGVQIQVVSLYVGTESPAGGGGCEKPSVPIAYWKFDEVTDAAGFADSAGGRFTALASNMASPEGPSTDVPTLKFTDPRSVQLDGSDDYVSVSYDSDFDLIDGLSITAWIKPETFGADDDVDAIVRKGEANPNKWQLAIEDGMLTMMLDSGDGTGGRAQGATVLSANTWYHVAGTWNGETVNLYVNGVLDGTNTHTGPISTDSRDIYIGGRIGADSFDGYIDDVRIFNEAVTAAYISKLASGHP